MPKKILAEEIERFLGTITGVASARLLTSPSGEVDQIYVTAGDALEGRAVRRSIVAALMTEYGLPVEPWRIQVTRLRDGPRIDELPDFRVLRVEESASHTQVAAKVQVAWVRGEEQRTATGQASGPAGSAHRLRTLASATLEALRGVLEPGHRRITLQQVALMTFADRSVAMVGIAAGGPQGQKVFVGVAPQQEEPQDAAIAATLDAVTKWLLYATFADPEALDAGDRRAQLEAMRHFARSDGDADTGPAIARVPAAPPQRSPSVETPKAVIPTHDGVASANPDILKDLREIRPQQKGGTTMATHDEIPRVAIPPSRAGRQAIEDGFYQTHMDARTPLRIRCRDGYEISRAVLHEVGTYALLVEVGGTTELVYKHAIISIRPIDRASEA